MMTRSRQPLFPPSFRAKLMAAALMGSAVALGASVPALAQNQAEVSQAEIKDGIRFVENKAETALEILRNPELTVDAKAEKFRIFVNSTADVHRVTRFVLGRYARGFSEEEYQEFTNLFKEYAFGVYESRLSDYEGENLKVIDAIPRRPGDMVVTTVATGGQLSEDTPVRWRIMKDKTGQWRLVDVEVFGVWLAIAQRQEFTTILNNNGGNPEALLNRLRKSVNKADAGSKKRQS